MANRIFVYFAFFFLAGRGLNKETIEAREDGPYEQRRGNVPKFAPEVRIQG